MNKKKLVVFLEWASKGRDFEIIFPLMYFFEKELNWRTKYLSIFDKYKLIQEKPDLIVMSNTTGANINCKIAEFIHEHNITLFSHVSEGLFQEDKLDQFLWGNNKTKSMLEKYSMLWSKKAYEMSIKHYPKLKEKLKISGSVGHDKYKLFKSKRLFDSRFSKKILYAGFDFHNSFSVKKNTLIKVYGEEIYSKLKQHQLIINKNLQYLVKENQDVLFVIKGHPGDRNKIPMECKGIEDYKNVEILPYNTSIFDAIANCDLVLNFISSTNLEAWLLNKPSISMCVDDEILSITEISKAAINCKDPVLNDSYIKEFYKNGTIKEFDKKKTLQIKFIQENIGFNDGLNHVRFLSFLKKDIEKEKKDRKWNISYIEKIKLFMKHIIYKLAKGKSNIIFLKKFSLPYQIFKKKDIEIAKKEQFKEIELFYQKHKEEIEYLYKNYAEVDFLKLIN